MSADRGRTWRTIPLAAGMVLTDPVVLASIPGGGAYLVGRRPNDLPDVRRIDGPDGNWRRITPPDGPNSAYSAVVDDRGLLGRGRQRQGLAARAGRPVHRAARDAGLPGRQPGAARAAVDARHRGALLRRRPDLAVGAAGLTNRGARGLGGGPGHRGGLARRESWVMRAANRRGHAGVAGDRSSAGTAVVSRRGR